VLAARSRSGLQSTSDEISAATGRDARLVVLDVTKEEAVRSVFSHLARDVGEIHILVNNAGTQRPGWAAELGLPEWREVLETNLTAAFTTSQEFARQSRSGGSIINIASIGNFVGIQTQAATRPAKLAWWG
jgi:NAD(P)-dependent dehydrogenase (short-subunit alcohol dehydrogenase family)